MFIPELSSISLVSHMHAPPWPASFLSQSLFRTRWRAIVYLCFSLRCLDQRSRVCLCVWETDNTLTLLLHYTHTHTLNAVCSSLDRLQMPMENVLSHHVSLFYTSTGWTLPCLCVGHIDLQDIPRLHEYKVKHASTYPAPIANMIAQNLQIHINVVSDAILNNVILSCIIWYSQPTHDTIEASRISIQMTERQHV